MGSKIQRELAFLLTGRDVSASRAMDKVNRKITGTQRHAGKAFANIGQNMERGILIGAGASAAAIGYALNRAIDWESAFAGVRKTVEGTPEQLAAIADGLREMSREMPVTAVELAAIAENAGALGIARDDILEFTRTVAMIGATTDVSTDAAATALGQLQNVLGLTGADFASFAAALVDLGNKGASTEQQILEIARRAGGASSLIGVAKDETLGWAAAAANLGMNEELAGTSLQRFFQTALAETAAGGEKLRTLAETAGMTGRQFKKAFGKDASGALSSFIKGLGKLPKEQRLKVVQSVFGKGTGLTRLIIGLADSFERNLNPSLETSADAWAASSAAQAEYEKRVQTTEAQLTLFRNNIDDAAITIGTNLLPTLIDLSKEGVSWLEDHQPEIQQFGKDLAAGVREAVGYLKSLDWDAIGTSLKAGADAAKSLVDVFTGLPPEIQQLLVGGFVANKLTGGVGTDILGGVAGGLFKGMVLKSLGVQAGIVNVNGPVAPGKDGLPTGGGTKGGGKPGTFQPTPRGGGRNLPGVIGMIAASSVVVQGDTVKGAPGGAMSDAAFLADLRTMLAQGRGNEKVNSNETVVQAIERLTGAVARLPQAGTVANDPTGFLNSGPMQALAKTTGDTHSEQIATTRAVNDVASKEAAALVAFRAGERTSATGLANTALASRTAGVLGAVSTSAGASRIVGAIAANRPIVTTTVNVHVTAASVTKSTTQQSRAGASGGSSSGRHPGGGGP